MTKTLVILPGWEHSKKDWEIVATKFASEWQVVVMDLPGFGSEALVSRDWDIPDYAKWVVQKITELNVGEVVLLGHSFGGRISAYLASQGPTWLKALILYGAPTLYRPSLQTKVRSNLAKLAKPIAPQSWRKYFFPAELLSADGASKGEIFRKVVLFDQTTNLPQINVPTLLIWGELDEAAPVAIAVETQKLIPNSQLQILPGLGHNVHIENANLFYGTIKNFLRALA